MKRKKTKMEKDKLDRMKGGQLVRLLEGSSDECIWKKISNKRSDEQIVKWQVEFDKKGPDNVIWDKKGRLSNNMMKNVKSVLYEKTVMKKFEGCACDNASDVGKFNSLNRGLYSMKVMLGRMMELAYVM
jgi:hypothetical protein